VGWYYQSDTPPDIPLMQAQHAAFVAALEAERRARVRDALEWFRAARG
jgi:hypothetical protein